MTAHGKIYEHIHRLMEILRGWMTRDLYLVEIPVDDVLGPFQRIGMKASRGIRHVNCLGVCGMLASDIAVPGTIKLVWLVPENFQDIYFRRPITIHRQQPE